MAQKSFGIALGFLVFAACSAKTSTPAAAVSQPVVDVAAAVEDVPSAVDVAPLADVPADIPKPPVKKPNFVMFLGEAIGWTGTQVQFDPAVPSPNKDAFKTPNLDTLAQSGARFSHFYAASPRCMPTRAALFAGRSPAQLHMTFIPADGDGAGTGTVVPPATVTTLPTSTPTIASWLKAGGYATAHYGKWHAGNTPPEQYGFDASDGATSNTGPGKVKVPNPKEIYDMTTRALTFMEESVKAGKPFYIQISNYNARAQAECTPENYAAALAAHPGQTEKVVGLIAGGMDFDVNIGRVLAKMKELGIEGSTYTMYSADHGGQDNWSNAPLALNKGTVWEGGIRVPMVWHGPGIAAGVVSPVQSSTVDIFPTVAALSGIAAPLPEGLEGGDISPLLLGNGQGDVQRSFPYFTIHFPHYDHDPLGPASTIIIGNYKFIRFYDGGLRKLFDLSKDIGEKQDLAASMPEKVLTMEASLDAYLQAIGAQMPTVP